MKNAEFCNPGGQVALLQFDEIMPECVLPIISTLFALNPTQAFATDSQNVYWLTDRIWPCGYFNPYQGSRIADEVGSPEVTCINCSLGGGDFSHEQVAITASRTISGALLPGMIDYGSSLDVRDEEKFRDIDWASIFESSKDNLKSLRLSNYFTFIDSRGIAFNPSDCPKKRRIHQCHKSLLLLQYRPTPRNGSLGELIYIKPGWSIFQKTCGCAYGFVFGDYFEDAERTISVGTPTIAVRRNDNLRRVAKKNHSRRGTDHSPEQNESQDITILNISTSPAAFGDYTVPARPKHQNCNSTGQVQSRVWTE
jgi:hypothetical protein